MADRERRYAVTELRAEASDPEKPTTISGYAAVFEQEAVIGGMFREVVKPGAFKRAISQGQDVRALWNHDPSIVLGRTKSGTLKLREDDHGLRVEITPPDTQTANDLVESIRRGDVDAMSFGFQVVEETWVERKDETPLRELRDLDLFDVSPVAFPAYQGTEVGLRNAEAVYHEHCQELATQEDDSAEAELEDCAQEGTDFQSLMDVFKTEV